jgi:hypothetical protein
MSYDTVSSSCRRSSSAATTFSRFHTVSCRATCRRWSSRAPSLRRRRLRHTGTARRERFVACLSRRSMRPAGLKRSDRGLGAGRVPDAPSAKKTAAPRDLFAYGLGRVMFTRAHEVCDPTGHRIIGRPRGVAARSAPATSPAAARATRRSRSSASQRSADRGADLLGFSEAALRGPGLAPGATAVGTVASKITPAVGPPRAYWPCSAEGVRRGADGGLGG